MPKMTVLAMVQDILSDMDSDDVNGISDTPESLQVAQILSTTYHEIIDSREWPHLRQLISLEAGTPSKPTHMKMPEDLQSIITVKYNKRLSTDTKDNYNDVTYLDPESFLGMVNSRDSSSSDVDVIVDVSGVSINIINNVPCTYWTSFDDEYVVFDSYDSVVESFLQESKSQCMAYKEAAFTISDTFIPDLPSKVFSYLLAEAKSVSFNVLKQMPNAKEEQRAGRQKARLGQDKWRAHKGITFPNYGRT